MTVREILSKFGIGSNTNSPYDVKIVIPKTADISPGACTYGELPEEILNTRLTHRLMLVSNIKGNP